uniref:hypothetical protein n=1 Tax=Ornithinimicrobium sp. CNJ-824 TaxID=1904966 RepID=UPI0031581263
MLRALEHRLQLHRMRRTHVMPTADASCAAWVGRSASGGRPTVRWSSGGERCSGTCAGCTNGSSTARCWAPWPGCPPTRSGCPRRRPGSGSPHSASGTRTEPCATSAP